MIKMVPVAGCWSLVLQCYYLPALALYVHMYDYHGKSHVRDIARVPGGFGVEYVAMYVL